MIEVSIPTRRTACAFEAERPDAALQLQRRLIRHRHRQRGQRLEAVGHRAMASATASLARRAKSTLSGPRSCNAGVVSDRT